MPSKSKSQQRFFGVVKGIQKGTGKGKGKAKKAAKDMSPSDVDDFASTKHKGKPEKVKREMKVRNLIKKMVREELKNINEVNFEKIKLPSQVNRFLNKQGHKKEAKELQNTFTKEVGRFRKFMKIKFLRMIDKLI